MRFKIRGQRVRETCKTTSKTIARQVELNRKHELEHSRNGITKREEMPLFRVAAKDWLSGKTNLTELGLDYYNQYVRKLNREYGIRLVSDMTDVDIARLQRKRLDEWLSPRQINAEVATLRCVLRHSKCWDRIKERVHLLPKTDSIGRALTPSQERDLLQACAESTSPSLYTFVLLSLDAGLRPNEIRGLRFSSLACVWQDGAIVEGTLTVGQSKTETSTGRRVPLTRRLCGALTIWIARFPNAQPDHYLFPHYHAGGRRSKGQMSAVDPTRPMSRLGYRRSFEAARGKAGLPFRYYDLRHSFISRLAERPDISLEVIRQLAGHEDPRMIAVYSHARDEAKRAAIAALDSAKNLISEVEGPQKGPQSGNEEPALLN